MTLRCRMLGLVLAACAAGCGPQARGVFEAAAFTSPTYGYRIDYVEGERYRLAGPDWRVDSHKRCGAKPCGHKATADFLSDQSLDLDGDDAPDVVEKTYAFDVALRHRNNFGTIWVRTLPIGIETAEMDLGPLALEQVERIAALEYEEELAEDGDKPRKKKTRERRYATKVLDSQAISVAGQPAHVVLFDAAQLSQLQMDRSQPGVRVALVVARLGAYHEVQTVEGTVRLPVLLLAGYSNRPEEFEASVADFRRLLESIRRDAGHGDQG